MNIVFAIKGLHQAPGGAERVIGDIAALLARRGHKISLLSFDAPGLPPFYPLTGEVERISLGIGNPRVPTSLPMLVARVLALRRFMRRRRPDAVVAFMHSMFIPMAFALAGTGIPLVASEHIVRQHYRRRWGQFLLFLASVPFAHVITVLSSRIAAQYPRWISRKMVPIPNPIGPAFLEKAAAMRGNKDSPPEAVILSVGRFDDQKNHIVLIKAFASLADEFKDWSLRIVGNGPLRAALQDEVRRMGLEGRVALPGAVKEIDREFAKASFFALASKYESFGLVVAEAMACGKAPVTFAACPGVNEIIVNEKTGLLVEGNDSVRAMADGLRRLMTDTALRDTLGEAARKDILRRFSLEQIGARWEKVIGEAVSSG